MSDYETPLPGLIDTPETELVEHMAARLDTLLPPMYRESYETVAPVSMGSAGLRFDAEGRVAWDCMWGSFCNLAMAGGPPHKGRLLEPASLAEIEAEPGPYGDVTAEIARGIGLVTGMAATPTRPGWVRVQCLNDAMAAWMQRAITMENVAVRGMGSDLELPAGPAFALEKEIKNVITVSAKAAHYWEDHMPRTAQVAVARLLLRMDAEQPLLAPAFTPLTGRYQVELRHRVAEEMLQRSGLRVSGPLYGGWIGFDCSTVGDAVALMRLVLVFNVLARREESVLFLPLHAALDPQGRTAANAVHRAQLFLKHKQQG